MNRLLRHAIVAIPLVAIPSPPPGHDQELFRMIFGEQICHFDPRARNLKPGETLKVENTTYFIDMDSKHDDRLRPILVKAIDRDGDGVLDKDNDLYIADLHADGTVDSVVEYIDNDHDNALDEMAIYTYSANSRNLGTDTIQVWWSRDIGHDHKLWETVNYRYQQKECQFRSHFNGDEIFSNYVFNAATRQWVPGWENPFAFYDEDGDNLSEVVIRFSGPGNRIESMRYSFDADNSATEENPHSYDFGFTCLASRKQDDGRTIPLPLSLTEGNHLWNMDAGPVLAWKHARKFGESAPWGRVLFSWVESGRNIDTSPKGDPRSRWEGVIASPTEHFPQVGGPPVGPYNVRYETDLDNSGAMKLYYSAVDRRIHLRGADEGWLKVDSDLDGKVDFSISYKDTDRDGVIDEWEIDVDGDGAIDRTVKIKQKTKPVPLNYKSLVALYISTMDEALTQNEAIIQAMKSALRKQDPSFQEDKIQGAHASREAKRLSQDVIRERYFVKLQKALAGQTSFQKVQQLYDAGSYTQAAVALKN